MAILRSFARFWTSWLGGIAICGLAAGVLAVAVMFGGIYNTGADNPHLKIVGWAIHQTMISSVRKRAATNPEYPPIDQATLLAGTKVYEAHCLACHGGPGVTRAPWTNGMLPTPPYLIDSRTRWSRTELHELVAHGVKMSGMPAWQEILRKNRSAMSSR
jgi:mono/diheme cytochrome c family protein